MTLIGFHIDSDIKDIYMEIERIKNLKCNFIQIFVKPMIKNADIIYLELKNILKQNKISCVVHSNYTFNCANNWDKYSWWVNQLIMEIEMANIIGAYGIVIHLGKQIKLSYEKAFENMVSSLKYVHEKTKQYNVKLLIETSSGQGSEMCYKIEELAKLYKYFSKNDRFGICLDTCHIFASGYNLKDNKHIDIFFNMFDKLIGITNIKLIHLSDSKEQIGSHKDRHINFDDGYIGSKSLKYIFNFFNKLKVPIIIETPYNKQKHDLSLL